jgi:hypothetical protein
MTERLVFDVFEISNQNSAVSNLESLRHYNYLCFVGFLQR